MSYDRMVKADNEFAEVVKGWLDQAEITDLGEDHRFRNRQGDSTAPRTRPMPRTASPEAWLRP
jgi:hypothetical protein